MDRAIYHYSQALEFDPNNAFTFSGRACAKKLNGDPSGAIIDYTQALALSPRFANGYFLRGDVKRVKGDLEGAIADESQAIELDNPSNFLICDFDHPGVVWSNYNVAWFKKTDRERARASAYNIRGEAKRAKGDTEGAGADHARAIELDPGRAKPDAQPQ